MAQLSTLGIKIGLRFFIELIGLAKIRAVSIAMRQISAVRFGLARAWRCELTERSVPKCERFDWPDLLWISRL